MFDIVCTLTERDRIILETKVVVDTFNRAQRMEDNFRDHPEVVYKGILSLLSGNINFIFN